MTVFHESRGVPLLPQARWLRALTIGGMVLLVLFALLTATVALSRGVSWDRAVLDFIQTLEGERLIYPAKWVAIAGSAEGTLLTAAVLSLWIARRGGGPWAIAPFAILLTLPIELTAKFLVPQPQVAADVLREPFRYPLLSLPTPGPFPSGHAARTAFWLAFGLPILLRHQQRWGAATLGIYGVFGISGRLILGEHWPSDVLGGSLLGAGIGLIVASLFLNRKPARK